MSEDVLTAAATPPIAEARPRPWWVTPSCVAVPVAAVLVAIALPGWIEVAPWRIVATSPLNALPPHIALTSAYEPQRTVVTIVGLVVGLVVSALVCGAIVSIGRRAGRDEASSAGSRRAVRLLAAANGALLLGGVATAFYLRQSGQPLGWRNVLGFDFANYKAVTAIYILDGFSPQMHAEAVVSSRAQWLIAGGVILVALLAAIGLSRLRLPRAKASKFVPFGAAAAVMSLVVVWVERSQLRTVPQYFLARNPTTWYGQLHPAMTQPRTLDRFTAANSLFTHSGYGAVVVAFGLLVVVELVALAALFLYVTVLAARRKVSSRDTGPVRAARDLAVVVAVTVLLGTVVGLVTT